MAATLAGGRGDLSTAAGKSTPGLVHLPATCPRPQSLRARRLFADDEVAPTPPLRPGRRARLAPPAPVPAAASATVAAAPATAAVPNRAVDTRPRRPSP